MPDTATLSLDPLGFPWDCVDPFLFCAHHLDRYPAGDGALAPVADLAGRELGNDFSRLDGWSMYHGQRVPGFPGHPHRGFETVSLARQGLIDHSDSLGGAARYGAGDVQWLTAGGGIQHSEMFPLVRADGPNTLELFQIWLNLPARSKAAAPHFSMFWSKSVPKLAPAPGVGLTLVAGGFQGVQPPAPPPDSWAARPENGVAIWGLSLEPGARWTLPAAEPGLNRALYLHTGKELSLDGRAVQLPRRALLRSDAAVTLVNGPEPAQALLLQGRPIGEPVAKYGPFVANTKAELARAFDDYQRTRFGGWPWGKDDPVHAPGAGRFARFPDGHEERPD